ADRRDGPDHRYLAHGSRVPQRPVSLPLLPGSRATTGRSGRRPTDPDRPSSPGRAPSLARPLALEGPGPIALLDRGHRRDRASGHLPFLEGLPPPGLAALAALAGPHGPAQSRGLHGA